MASLGHTGRRVVLGHTLNTLSHKITKQKSHNVLSKIVILCWAAFTANLSCMRPAGHRLDVPTLDDSRINNWGGGLRDKKGNFCVSVEIL